MRDERNARPVSGEIMAAPAGADASRAMSLPADVVDAEFETLRPDPSERLTAPQSGIGTAAPPAQGLDTLRKGDVAPPPAGRGGPLFWIVGLSLAAAAFWASGGHALVRQTALAPPAPQIEPANPLRIADVTSRVEEHGGRAILFVDGRAVNDGDGELPAPPIEISVTANDGGVTRYNLGTSRDPLPGGTGFSFSSRFEAPKGGVKSVSVTFREQ